MAIYSEEGGTGSIHARGMWPKLDIDFGDFNHNQCDVVIEIVGLVRKLKANDNLSIKVPIKILQIKGCDSLSNILIEDLKNVLTVENIEFVRTLTINDKNIKSDNGLEIGVQYAS